VAELAEGRLGTVIAEIDAIEDLSSTSKALIRLQTLCSIGLGLEVRKELESNPELTADLDPKSALTVATLAEESDADLKAAEVLASAEDGLHSQEDLEIALDLAVKLGDARLIGVFEKKLSLQFPGSDGLRRHRLSRCLRDRNYAAAAALFAHGSVEDREAFEYYDQLSKSFAETGEFDSPAVLRHLSERFPSRRRQACAHVRSILKHWATAAAH